jgi:4-amino-4-deoxy-L-arabinose transferase-like glycosyltransferase
MHGVLMYQLRGVKRKNIYGGIGAGLLILWGLMYENIVPELIPKIVVISVAVICLGMYIYTHKSLLKEETISVKNPKFNVIEFLSVILIIGTFIFVGLYQLGNFMTVDEPKWIYFRVPQLVDSLAEGRWSDTYINDKPGILPSILSSGVYLFDNQPRELPPGVIEKFLLLWRAPIILFNAGVLYVTYRYLRKGWGVIFALVVIALTGLNPVLIGISKVVNPDATLWSTTLLTLSLYLLYLKSNRKKYLYLSAVAMAFGLLSKYFISLMFIFLIILHTFEYLGKDGSREKMLSRIFDLSIFSVISVSIFGIFFPATWANSSALLEGTFYSFILRPGLGVIVAGVGVLMFEIIIMKGMIVTQLRKVHFQKIYTLLFGLTFSSILIIMSINLVMESMPIFNIPDALMSYDRGNGDILYMIKMNLTSFIGVNSFIILFAILIYPALSLVRKNEENLIVSNSLLSMIFMFLIAAAVGGYWADTRYQIMIFPILSLFVAYILIQVVDLQKRKTLLMGVVCSMILVSISQIPVRYPYNFTNQLNRNKVNLTEAWGFGGYEAAQYLNNLENSENLTIWVDREGVAEFVNGNVLWRADENPFEYEGSIDYLVLTWGGEKIYRKHGEVHDSENIYSNTANTTPIFEYYSGQFQKSIFEKKINGIDSNYVRVIPFN